MNRLFRDRTEAGQLLAQQLLPYAGHKDLLILALPRGGIPVAYQVACALHAPLDVFIVRKLGVPGQEELAMGAIASGGIRVLNYNVLASLHLPDDLIESAAERELAELERRARRYRGHTGPPQVAGRTTILVDDGIATGSTMEAAVRAIRRQHPAQLVIAVPTTSRQAFEQLAVEVDDMIALMSPDDFFSVGQWYEDFSQITDEEVIQLLEQAFHLPATC